MVMESPSPQLVGQEFVRQYYTLLHEGPKYLHRFYNANSSYIHGGIVEGGGIAQEPVVGQSEIHKRIMALNFNQCHTKIRQVDSQATVAGAVVVQVTGELSNNGAPMRRFMQTFVLAPQSPNKYYVHNDIFRYQDEVFLDEYESPDEELTLTHDGAATGTGAQHSEPRDHVPLLVQSVQQPQVAPPVITSAPPVETGYTAEARGPALVLGHGKKDEPAKVPSSSTEAAAGDGIERQHSDSPVAPPVQPHDQRIIGHAGGATEAGLLPTEKTSKTWSTVLTHSAKPASSSTNSSSRPNEMHGRTEGTALASPVQLASPEAVSKQPSAGDQSQPGVTSSGGTTDSGTHEAAPVASTPKQPYYPDAQQVFAGNLPADATVEDLKVLFTECGDVLAVKVVTSPQSRTPYAFVTFTTVESAQRALEKKGFTCKGQRINVEEKRPQARYSRGGMGGRYNYYKGGGYYNRDHRGGGVARPVTQPPGQGTGTYRPKTT